MSNINFPTLVTKIEKAFPGHDAYELANQVQLPGAILSDKEVEQIADSVIQAELQVREALENE